jgi:hypothetical protein
VYGLKVKESTFTSCSQTSFQRVFGSFVNIIFIPTFQVFVNVMTKVLLLSAHKLHVFILAESKP